jgi:N-acetylmuramoyl-L-alanine amidase
MKSGLWLIPLLLSPAAVGPTLPRPELRTGTVVRLSQTDPGGYRTVGEAADGPALLITFPPVEMTTTPEAAIRLAGRIEPGREVRVNGEPVEVYPGGSFVALVPLAGGENEITVSVRGGRGETVYPLAIRREAAKPGTTPRREDFPRPLAGRAADPGGPLRYLPAGPRLLELPGGARLRLTGREGGWLRADLGGGLSGWLSAGAVELGGEAPAEPAPVGNISFDAERSRAWFSLASPVPARVDYLSPEELEVVFHNAVPAAETIDLGDWEGICLPVPSRDGTARFRLRGGLDCHRWSLEYLPGGCRLSWRGRPRRGEGPVCLDPGHGGEQRGAVSPSGLAEKDANLALARTVAEKLEKAGVETILTRDGDRTLALDERIEIARRRGAGLFLSLHHNSVGSGRDPRAGRGYTVFYYHPPGRELAGEIHRTLKAAGREGSGVRRRSLAVIRPTDLVTALLETAYLSHPEDEAEILDPAVREKTAAAIADGVLNYLTTGMSPARP